MPQSATRGIAHAILSEDAHRVLVLRSNANFRVLRAQPTVEGKSRARMPFLQAADDSASDDPLLHRRIFGALICPV